MVFMQIFIASRFWSSNPFPDRLEIDEDKVVCYKPGIAYGYKSTVIKRENIASIRVNMGLFAADVLIETYGGEKVIASGFTKTDAKQVEAIFNF